MRPPSPSRGLLTWYVGTALQLHHDVTPEIRGAQDVRKSLQKGLKIAASPQNPTVRPKSRFHVYHQTPLDRLRNRQVLNMGSRWTQDVAAGLPDPMNVAPSLSSQWRTHDRRRRPAKGHPYLRITLHHELSTSRRNNRR